MARGNSSFVYRLCAILQMPSIRGASSRDVSIQHEIFISALGAARLFCNRAMGVDTKPSRCPVNHFILCCELYFV